MKTDTSDIEALFIEEPVKKGRNNRVGAKPAKRPKNGLSSVSSFGLVKELFRRHNVDLQIAGFWLAVAFIIWQKLG